MAINCALWRHEHWKSSHPRCVWEALQLLHIRFHPYILTPCWLHTMHSQSSQIIPFKHSQFRVQPIDLCRVLWAWCMAAFPLNNRRLIEKLDIKRDWCNFQKTLFDDVSMINTLKSIILGPRTQSSVCHECGELHTYSSTSSKRSYCNRN